MKTSSRTSPPETRQIEKYLQRQMGAEEQLLFEAQLVLHPELAERVQWQRRTYVLVRKYGRQQLRAELEQVHRRLFTRPEHRSFRQKILRLFSR